MYEKLEIIMGTLEKLGDGATYAFYAYIANDFLANLMWFSFFIVVAWIGNRFLRGLVFGQQVADTLGKQISYESHRKQMHRGIDGCVKEIKEEMRKH